MNGETVIVNWLALRDSRVEGQEEEEAARERQSERRAEWETRN